MRLSTEDFRIIAIYSNSSRQAETFYILCEQQQADNLINDHLRGCSGAVDVDGGSPVEVEREA